MGVRIRLIDLFVCLLVLAGIGVLIFIDVSISNKNPKKEMLDNIYTLLSTIAILISGVVGFWKLYLKKQIENSKKRETLLLKLSDMLPLITAMAAEFKPNGGSSLKDSQIRIEQTLSILISNLKDLKDNQRVFFDIMELPYWLSDENGKCIYASQGLCDIMGRTQEEILGNNWATWLHPNSKNTFEEWMDSIKEKRIFKLDYIFKRRDGRWQDVAGYAQHKFNNDVYMGSVGKLSKKGEPYI